MTDWINPSTSQTHSNELAATKGRDESNAKMDYSADSNIPDGTIRWSSVNSRFEVWDATGSTWSALVSKYLINVDQLDGADAGNASGNVALANGTKVASLNADQVDGYHAGNASGRVAVNNGTLNTNLNADRLDGQEGSYYTNGANISAATSSARGTAEIATQAEVDAETDDGRIVTPKKLASRMEHFVPAGAIEFWGANSPPGGWLECDGSAVSRTTYSELFSAIGTTFGSGDGSTSFNIPDLRGEFIRGWDNGRGVDSGRAFANSQLDQMQRITGRFTTASGDNMASFYFGAFTLDTAFNSNRASGTGDNLRLDFDSGDSPNARVSSTTNGETRPRNVALMSIIKY